MIQPTVRACSRVDKGLACECIGMGREYKIGCTNWVPIAPNVKGSGLKYDADKPDMTLLMDLSNALESVVRVMEFGEKKYRRGSFVEVQNGIRRYHAAANRHWLKPIGSLDDESKLLHLAHEACDALFTLEVYIREQEKLNAPST